MINNLKLVLNLTIMNNPETCSFISKHKSVPTALLFPILVIFLFSCGKSGKEEVTPVPTAPISLAEGDVYYSNGKDGYVLHDPDGAAQVFKIASFGNVVKDIAIDDKSNKVYWLVGDSTVVATGPEGTLKNTWKKNTRMTDMDCAEGELYVIDSTNSRITSMNTNNGGLGSTIVQINELFTVIYSLSASRYPGGAGSMYFGKRGVEGGTYFYYSIFNSTTKLFNAQTFCMSVNPNNVVPGKGLYLTQVPNNIITLYESGVNPNEWSGKVVANDLLSTRFEVYYKKNVVYYAKKVNKKLVRKNLNDDIPDKIFDNVDVSAEFAVDVVNL